MAGARITSTMQDGFPLTVGKFEQEGAARPIPAGEFDVKRTHD